MYDEVCGFCFMHLFCGFCELRYAQLSDTASTQKKRHSFYLTEPTINYTFWKLCMQIKTIQCQSGLLRSCVVKLTVFLQPEQNCSVHVGHCTRHGPFCSIASGCTDTTPTSTAGDAFKHCSPLTWQTVSQPAFGHHVLVLSRSTSVWPPNGQTR